MNWIDVTTVVPLTIGVRSHVVMTYDGSSSAAGVKIFINGISQAVTIAYDTFTAAYTGCTEPFLIGHAGSHYFNGFIGNCRLWTKELTPTEVLLDYNGGEPAEPLADDLLLNIDMTDGSTFDTNWTLENRTGLTVDGTSVNMDLTNRIKAI